MKYKLTENNLAKVDLYVRIKQLISCFSFAFYRFLTKIDHNLTIRAEPIYEKGKMRLLWIEGGTDDKNCNM